MPLFGTYTDVRDGKVYRTVLMPDGKWWAAENLAWVGAGVDYDYNSANRVIYGRLYTWAEALASCPSGTHLPTDAEWTTMEAACGDSSTLGTRFKATSGWDSGGDGSDAYGFGVLPGGLRSGISFFNIGTSALLWSATESASGVAWFRVISYNSPSVSRTNYYTDRYQSVRFIVDSGNIPDDYVPALESPFPVLAPTGPEARSLLLEQYHEKPRIEGVVAQLAEEADRIDAAHQELWALYDMDRATAATLDTIGELANEPRKGRDDAAYKEALEVLLTTQISGTPKDVARSVAEVTGVASVQTIPEYPAGFFVLADTEQYIQPLINRVSAAGVQGMHGTRLALSNGGLLKTHSNSVQAPRIGDTGTFTDTRDGKVYKVAVMPDGKWWATENLSYNDGTGLFYANGTENGLGRYYPPQSLASIAPVGCHVATSQDWRDLFAAIGGGSRPNRDLRSYGGWYGGVGGSDSFRLGILSHGQGTSNGTSWTTGGGNPNQTGYYAVLWGAGPSNTFSSVTFYQDNRVQEAVTDGAPDTTKRYPVRFIVDTATITPGIRSVTGTYTDVRDGRVYKTALMPDGKWWFAENFAYRGVAYRSPNGNVANEAAFGLLYNIGPIRAAVPAGCRLPNDADWVAFRSAVIATEPGGNYYLRGLRQSTPTDSYWTAGTSCADSHRFGARAAGMYNQNSFANFLQDAYFHNDSSNPSNLYYAGIPSGSSSGLGAGGFSLGYLDISFAARFIVESGNVPDSPSWILGSNSADILVVNTL